MMNEPPPKATRKAKVAASLVFWLWNALALSLLFFGVVPHVLADLLKDTSRGLVPWDFTLAVLGLMAVPVLCSAWAVRLIHQPVKLIGLFYGLEVPLCLLLAARTFLVRELTPGLALVLACFALAGGFFAYHLGLGISRRRWAPLVQLSGHTIALAASAYLAVVLAFYVPVLAVAFGKWFFGFEWVRPFFEHLFSLRYLLWLAAGTLFMFSAFLFLAVPVALVWLYGRSFRSLYGAAAARLSVMSARLVAVGTAGVLAVAFVALNQQPQRKAFELLAQPPKSDAERAKLLSEQEAIREGLLQAYLGAYRFFGSRANADGTADLYKQVLGFSKDAAATVQRAHNALLRPLLYDGESMPADSDLAAKQYAEFFDTPIQKRERAGILQALAATWDRDQREAGLLNQDSRRVKLVKQELRVTESGATADIEVHDTYVNQTFEQQEILLHFSLPESAVITGLWLGDTEDRAKRFAFTVSPRGAAQAVYRAQVQRRVDPALIEQVGPSQYRLRAFPIPPKPREEGAAPALHLWLTYATTVENGRWPTPHLSERRNVFWDDSTERLFDGRVHRGEQEEWVGLALPARSAAYVAQEAILPGGFLLRREPLEVGRLALPTGQRLAVVVDRSFSMTRVKKELREALASLAQLERDNDVDLYLTSAATRGEPPSRVQDVATAGDRPLAVYGGGSLKQMLQQFAGLREGTFYNAVLVLTDDDSFDAGDDAFAPTGLSGALWVVHLGGQLAAGYDDETLELLSRSGGGVARSLRDALLRHAARRQGGAVVGVDGESLWTLQKTLQAETPVTPFTRLAVRQLILALSRQFKQGDVAALDELHGLAVRYPLVSSYSSMIVLVDDNQRKALQEAESKEDRYDREAESGNERLPGPGGMLGFAATPEPHEWVLICLAVAAGLVALRQRRGGLLENAGMFVLRRARNR